MFSTYPTPVDDANYIEELLAKNLFKVFLHKGRIVSVASSDIDDNTLSAEITDCATLPKYRGYGLMEILVRELEEDMKKRGLITLYSLARATSLGISKIFSRRGYNYRGRLIDNCHICGQFEDMNLWVKRLR